MNGMEDGKMPTIKKVAYDMYAKVNGVSVEEVKASEEMTGRVKSALLQVARYPDCYPGETEEKRDNRLEMVSPDNGEVSELSFHFKTLNPEYKQKTAWEIIFLMQNYLDGIHQDTRSEETRTGVKPNVNEAEVKADASDGMKEAEEASSENKTNKNKEERNMAEATNSILEEEMKRAEATQQRIENGETPRQIMDEQKGVAANTTKKQGSMPDSQSSGIEKEVAMEQLLADKDARLAMSKGAKITKVVFSQPTLEMRLVQGKAAKGTIRDPEKALSNFEKEMGAEFQKDGSYAYNTTAVPEAFVADVVKIHQALRDAVSHPETTFDVYIGKNGPSIRGVEIQVSGDDKSNVKTMVELLHFLYDKTLGQVSVSVGNICAVIRKIGKKSTTVGTPTGRATDKVKESDNPFKGHVTVGWSSRYSGEGQDKEDNLMQVASYHKELLREKKIVASGPKSDISCKYMKLVKKGDSQEWRVKTYRISLVAEQFDTEVINEEYRNVFGEASGIGKGTVAMDLNNQKDIETMMALMAESATDALSSGVTFGKDDFFSKVKDAAAAREAKQREADAEDLVNSME